MLHICIYIFSNIIAVDVRGIECIPCVGVGVVEGVLYNFYYLFILLMYILSYCLQHEIIISKYSCIEQMRQNDVLWLI